MPQSIERKFIIIILILFFVSISKSFAENKFKDSPNNGVIALMYHRFDENKYPSTNIRIEIFKKQIEEIKKLKVEFLHPKKFGTLFNNGFEKNYILLTIDDAFSSFYNKAWPILESMNIPFLLFVNTESIGKKGYMSWKQLKEIDESDLGIIGNHSHSHDYLINEKKEIIIKDTKTAIEIFKKELGYSPNIFSYPFGEYNDDYKKIVNNLNFEFAFGQHSGVIDISKNRLELPRFPINEKYGELDRFKLIINSLPLPYKTLSPENKYLTDEENPPEIKIVFFENLIKIENISCYSNDDDIWKKSEIEFLNKNELIIKIKKKFKTRRGRINCSLREKNNKWRWLGIQYVIAGYADK